jgi:hypothetical protein
MNIPRIGKQPPRFAFFLNPYQDARFTSCPECGGKTKPRKLPLAIHVEGAGMIVLNKTCRCCPGCDLLIAHQDEIEAQLAAFFTRRAPEVVGNDYLVVGTLDRPDWQRGRKNPLTNKEILAVLHDFKDVVRFKPSPGWIPPK